MMKNHIIFQMQKMIFFNELHSKLNISKTNLMEIYIKEFLKVGHAKEFYSSCWHANY